MLFSRARQQAIERSAISEQSVCFYDGHVEWVAMSRLVNVGPDMAAMCNNGEVLSVLP